MAKFSQIADPVCTIIFAVIVFCTSITILRDPIGILMEAVPRGLDYHEVKDDLLEVEGVVNVHDLRIWSITMDKSYAMAHIVTGAKSRRKHIFN